VPRACCCGLAAGARERGASEDRSVFSAADVLDGRAARLYARLARALDARLGRRRLPPRRPPAAASPGAAVNAFLGSERTGNTFPGATLPHGMAQLSPVVLPPAGAGWREAWRYNSGYHRAGGAAAARFAGLGHTALSGTGLNAGGDFLLTPCDGVGALVHATEDASPGAYAATLVCAGGLPYRVDAVAALRGGLARFSFGAGAPRRLARAPRHPGRRRRATRRAPRPGRAPRVAARPPRRRRRLGGPADAGRALRVPDEQQDAPLRRAAQRLLARDLRPALRGVRPRRGARDDGARVAAGRRVRRRPRVRQPPRRARRAAQRGRGGAGLPRRRAPPAAGRVPLGRRAVARPRRARAPRAARGPRPLLHRALPRAPRADALRRRGRRRLQVGRRGLPLRPRARGPAPRLPRAARRRRGGRPARARTAGPRQVLDVQPLGHVPRAAPAPQPPPPAPCARRRREPAPQGRGRGALDGRVAAAVAALRHGDVLHATPPAPARRRGGAAGRARARAGPATRASSSSRTRCSRT